MQAARRCLQPKRTNSSLKPCGAAAPVIASVSEADWHDKSGMFWAVRGANAILAPRCCHFNGRFEDYWEGRKAA